MLRRIVVVILAFSLLFGCGVETPTPLPGILDTVTCGLANGQEIAGRVREVDGKRVRLERGSKSIWVDWMQVTHWKQY